MAGVTESNNWSPEIYRFETEDVVQGGEDGLDNLPGKQLAGRTNWLRLMLTAVCAAEGVTVVDNETTQLLTAIDSRIGNAISELVDSSPAALDTLNELAAALGDDPNFAATITTELSLKAKWSTLDHIITAAGMTPDHADDAKLKLALDYLYNGGQAVKYYATGTVLPGSNIGPIWHADYNSVMTWQAFTANGAAYTGYASVMVGSLLADTQPTPRAGYVKSGTANLNRNTYAALRGWAMHNGIMVASGVWAAGTIAVCDNVDGTTFKIFDVRSEFPRYWDDGRGVDTSRAFGSWQKGTLVAIDTPINAVWGITANVDGQPSQAVAGVDDYIAANYAGMSMTGGTGSSNTALKGDGEGWSGVSRPNNISLLASVKF